MAAWPACAHHVGWSADHTPSQLLWASLGAPPAMPMQDTGDRLQLCRWVLLDAWPQAQDCDSTADCPRELCLAIALSWASPFALRALPRGAWPLLPSRGPSHPVTHSASSPFGLDLNPQLLAHTPQRSCLCPCAPSQHDPHTQRKGPGPPAPNSPVLLMVSSLSITPIQNLVVKRQDGPVERKGVLEPHIPTFECCH